MNPSANISNSKNTLNNSQRQKHQESFYEITSLRQSLTAYHNHSINDNKNPVLLQKRLNTEEVFNSYRQNYKMYELLQEISELKSVVDIKNKQIFYLSTQAVSIKEQYTQKVLQLEAVLMDNKRELTELRYQGLRGRRLESQKGERGIDEVKKNFEIQLMSQRENYQKVIDKINEQNRKQVEAMQDKMEALLHFQRREKSNIEEIAQQKCENSSALQLELKQYNKKLQKQKLKLEQQIQQYGTALDMIKEEFKEHSLKSEQSYNSLKFQNQRLKSVIATKDREIKNMKKEYEQGEQHTTKENEEFKQSNEMYQQQNTKLKHLLKQKDQQIEKMAELLNDVYKEKHSHKVPALNPVRNCQHEGLLEQMLKNITMKDKENQELRKQLVQWGSYIGFQKSGKQRTEDLLNASSEALSVQANFSSSLKRKFGKIK